MQFDSIRIAKPHVEKNHIYQPEHIPFIEGQPYQKVGNYKLKPRWLLLPHHRSSQITSAGSTACRLLPDLNESTDKQNPPAPSTSKVTLP